MVQLTNKKPC